MKKIVALLFLALALASQPAHAQFTKSILSTQVDQQFPDNNTGAITPSILRSWIKGSLIPSFQQYTGVNPQAGTSYTIQASDYGQLITFNNASPVAVTLPQAIGTFQTFNVYIRNLGAGLVTITPQGGSTIGGVATLAVTTGTDTRIVSDGTNYQIMTGSRSVRIPVLSPLTITVDPVNGNDNNSGNGLANAMKTVCGAFGYLQKNIDIYGNTLKIKLDSAIKPFTNSEHCQLFGTLTGGMLVGIEGDPVTPSNVIWDCGANNTTALGVRDFLAVSMNGVKLTTAFTGCTGLNPSQGAIIDYQNMEFGAMPGGFHILANPGGYMTWTGGTYVVSGSMNYHMFMQGSRIDLTGSTISVPNALNFTQWAALFSSAALSYTGAVSYTGAGGGAGSTGTKFLVTTGSSIVLNTTVLPGSAAGSLTTNGSTLNPDATAGFSAVGCSGVIFTTSGTCPSGSIATRFGAFDIWQRLINGATTIAQAASTTAYVNDGWYLLTGANQAATITQVAGIATGSQFSAKVQRNNGQTGTGVIRYAAPLFADEVSLLRGYNLSLSFTILEGANQSFSHLVNYIIYCGTGAPAKRGASAYAGETTPISGTVTTTTVAQRVTAVSAAVIPAGCTQIEVQFNFTPSGTAGADDSFTVDDLDIEQVPTSTSAAPPFPRWPNDQQMNGARAVFRLLGGGQVNTRIYVALAEGTSVMSVGGPLAPPMKSSPTPSFAGTAANIACNDLAVNAAFQGTFGTNYSSTILYGFQLNCANTLTQGKAGFINFNVSGNEALFLSSEL